jgi:hypothetical protein
VHAGAALGHRNAAIHRLDAVIHQEIGRVSRLMGQRLDADQVS